MWTAKNRVQYDHKEGRYPLNMTDEEWLLVKPLVPPLRNNLADRRRELLNAILYVLQHWLPVASVAEGLYIYKCSSFDVDGICALSDGRLGLRKVWQALNLAHSGKA